MSLEASRSVHVRQEFSCHMHIPSNSKTVTQSVTLSSTVYFTTMVHSSYHFQQKKLPLFISERDLSFIAKPARKYSLVSSLHLN